MAANVKGRFIDPMLLLRTDSLPNDGDRWAYQLKFDGYRAIAFKTGGKIHLRSRNDNDFSVRYANVVKGLAKLPEETVIDGEVIALDDDGRPSFNLLQNYGSSTAPVLYFVFDLMILAGRDVMRAPLTVRRELLENGFTPAARQQLFKKFRPLEVKDCPFVNLPETKSGRWGAGLPAAKMKDCRWLKPVLVAQIEFLEWTGENHLRHTKFIALRDDKPPREVMRE